MTGTVIRASVEFALRRISADRRRPDMVLGPACPVIMLPVIRIERDPDGGGVPVMVRRGRRSTKAKGIWQDG